MIYYISYLTGYEHGNPYAPCYAILNDLYFTSEEDAKNYVENNTTLKKDDYFIETLILYKKERGIKNEYYNN